MPQSHDNPSDADLVRSAASGSHTAYGVLVDRYLPAVFAVVVRIVGNHADAEDLAQETFLRAFRRLHMVDTQYPFRNWLLKMATNLSLNHLRADRRKQAMQRQVAEVRTDESTAPRTTEDIPDASDWQRWLDKLDPSQRTAIVLFHFEELSYIQIAEILETPVNTVRTLIHRGRRKLRDLMTQDQEAQRRVWNAVM